MNMNVPLKYFVSVQKLLPSCLKDTRIYFSTTRCRFKHCLISAKRKHLDYYIGTQYTNLDDVPLASKGWHHNKSKGDFFTVNPVVENRQEMVTQFSELNLDPEIINALKREGIEKATEFQMEAIPLIQQSGNHTLVAAETGCGKTLCYLLPIIQNLIGNKPAELNSPKALIIVPNRELAYQVGEVAQILAEPVNVRVKVLVGGQTKKIMMNPEFEDIDILVTTPGALGKLASVGVYRINNVAYTVLDEADTLLDDSFVERLTGIIKRLPESQIILTSATLPKRLPDILAYIEETLKQVISPNIHRLLLHIKQDFLRLTRSEKPSNLLMKAKSNKHPMIVFTNKNETSNWLAMYLRENGVPCSNINGDMNYAIRIQQWNDFVQGETKILSSTDVGSRGLDTTKVSHVINYDFPLYAADYLHRIGRTGRLGSSQSCKVTNFVAGYREIELVQQIEMAIRRNQALTNVDGNITSLVQKKILRNIREAV